MNPLLRVFAFSLPFAAASIASARDAASVYARAKAAVVTIRAGKSSGTGFVVGDGTQVLTCWHVVKGAAGVAVESGGQNAAARVIGHDSVADVALLRLSKPMRGRLALRTGPAPEPGTKIYAIGTPLGFLTHSITEGIVSGKRVAGNVAYLQITAPVSHGSSGGPVLDDRARVVGMVDFTISRGQGLNFAISSYNLDKSMAAIRIAGSRTKVAARPKTSPTFERIAISLGEARLTAQPRADGEIVYGARSAEILWVKRSLNGWLEVVTRYGSEGYVPTRQIRTATPLEIKAFFTRTPRPTPRQIALVRKIDQLDPDDEQIESLGQEFAQGGETAARLASFLARATDDETRGIDFRWVAVLQQFGAAAKPVFLDMLRNGTPHEKGVATYAAYFANLEILGAEGEDASERQKAVARRLAFIQDSDMADAIAGCLESPETGGRGFNYFSSRDIADYRSVAWKIALAPGEARIGTVTEAFGYLYDFTSPEESERLARAAENVLISDDLAFGVGIGLAYGRSECCDRVLEILSRSSCPAIRLVAAENLGRRESETSLITLVPLLDDADSKVALEALVAVGRRKGTAYAGRMRRVCNSEDPNDQSAGIRAIGALGEPWGMDYLRPFVRSPLSLLRGAVAEALGDFGGTEAIRLLQGLAKDADPKVRQAANDALASLESRD